MGAIEHEVVHTIITISIGLVSGGFGAGITIATFRNNIKNLKKSVIGIIDKQEKLRGNGGNEPPLFVRRGECFDFRADCNARVCILDHSKSIKSLEQFARWSMQNQGLSPQEISEILKVD